MTRTELSRHLRPYRRLLVEGAQKALDKAYDQGDQAFPPSKTQLSRLVNLCNEATCAEELENYLRYQAARKSSGKESEKWRMPFVDILLADIKPILDQITVVEGSRTTAQDLQRVEAWRLYATYLARAFTYKDAKRRSQDSGQRNQTQPRDREPHDQRKPRTHG